LPQSFPLGAKKDFGAPSWLRQGLIRRVMEREERKAARKRQSEAGGDKRGKDRLAKVSPSGREGRASDKIGAFTGISGRQVEKIAAVADQRRRECPRAK
jgi:hypothetical protein